MKKNKPCRSREERVWLLEEMQAGVLVREATEADLPAVLSLYTQLGMDDGAVLSEEEARRVFARMKTYPDYTLYAAVYLATVVGSFALLIMDNLGHIGAPSGIVEDVIVREDWRRKGVGRTMMEKAMSLCAAKGCYKLALTSNKFRHNAQLFYETLGFELQGFSYSVLVKPMSLPSGPCDECEKGAP